MIETLDIISLWIGRAVLWGGIVLGIRYLIPMIHNWMCQSVSLYSWLRDTITFPYWRWAYKNRWKDENKQFFADAIYYKEYSNWVARYFKNRLYADGFTPSEEIVEAKKRQ